MACSQLPNVLSCDAVSDPLWTHLDYVWGKQAPELVYRRVIADMKEAAYGLKRDTSSATL